MQDRAEHGKQVISIWEDLKRRNVYRVGVGYVALAWLLLQAAEIIFPRVGFPDWTVTMAIVVALVGFPIALFLGWTFEITPEGIVYDRPRGLRWPVYLVVDLVIVAVLVAAGSIYWFRIHQIESPTGKPADNSIAVLRFKSLSDDPRNLYFSDGLTEELIHELTNLRSFKVAARTSIWALSTAELEAPAIAKRLNVKRVLEGSVRSAGEKVRVTAQLIDDDGFHIWSKAYEREFTDFLDIQKDIAIKVVGELNVMVDDDSRTRLLSRPTRDTTAYDQYLQGRQLLRQPARADNLSRAEEFFEAATELDGRFSLAHAALCEAHLARYRMTRDTTNFEAAERACHRALTLDGGLAEVYTALGNLYRHAGDNVAAEAEYRTALSINPSLEEANFGLGRSYQAQGRLDEAEQILKKSVDLEPGFWGTHMGFGNFLSRQGRYEEAVPYYEKVTQLAPDYSGGFVNLGSALHWLGRWDEAEAYFRRSIELDPSSMGYQNMGTLYYYQGRFDDAAKMHEKAIEIAPSDHRAWGKLAAAQRYVPGQEAASQRNYEKAIEIARTNLDVNPDDAENLAYLAVYLINVREVEAAKASADRALMLAPESPSAHYFSAIVAFQTGNDGRGLAQLNLAVKFGYSTKLLNADPQFEHVREHADFPQ